MPPAVPPLRPISAGRSFLPGALHVASEPIAEPSPSSQLPLSFAELRSPLQSLLISVKGQILPSVQPRSPNSPPTSEAPILLLSPTLPLRLGYSLLKTSASPKNFQFPLGKSFANNHTPAAGRPPCGDCHHLHPFSRSPSCPAPALEALGSA